MKRISFWAKENPANARFILLIAHILIACCAVFLGLSSYINDVIIPSWLIILSANLFFVFFLLYPIKGRKRGAFKHSYWRQKTLDFALVMFGAFLLTAAINQFAFSSAERIIEGPIQAKFIVNKITPDLSPEKNKNPIANFKGQWKKMKKELKAELKAYKKKVRSQKEDSGIVILKIFLIILTLAVTVFLGILVAALACNISCSGSEELQ